MSIMRDGNRDQNEDNAADNKVPQGQARAKALQQLGKLEIVSEPNLKRFVVFLTLKILSMLSNLVYKKCNK